MASPQDDDVQNRAADNAHVTGLTTNSGNEIRDPDAKWDFSIKAKPDSVKDASIEKSKSSLVSKEKSSLAEVQRKKESVVKELNEDEGGESHPTKRESERSKHGSSRSSRHTDSERRSSRSHSERSGHSHSQSVYDDEEGDMSSRSASRDRSKQSQSQKDSNEVDDKTSSRRSSRSSKNSRGSSQSRSSYQYRHSDDNETQQKTVQEKNKSNLSLELGAVVVSMIPTEKDEPKTTQTPDPTGFKLEDSEDVLLPQPQSMIPSEIGVEPKTLPLGTTVAEHYGAIDLNQVYDEMMQIVPQLPTLNLYPPSDYHDVCFPTQNPIPLETQPLRQEAFYQSGRPVRLTCSKVNNQVNIIQNGLDHNTTTQAPLDQRYPTTNPNVQGYQFRFNDEMLPNRRNEIEANVRRHHHLPYTGYQQSFSSRRDGIRDRSRDRSRSGGRK